MSFDTYSNLQDEVARWAWKSGNNVFAESVPTMIALAERRINKALQADGLELTATVTLTAGAGALPADFGQMRTVKVTGGREPLDLISKAEADRRGTGSGYEDAYYLDGTSIVTMPAQAGTLTLSYFGGVAALSNAAPTNWLLTAQPEIYRSACMIEAALFMEDDERLAKWGKIFENDVGEWINAERRKRFSGGRLRVKGSTP